MQKKKTAERLWEEAKEAGKKILEAELKKIRLLLKTLTTSRPYNTPAVRIPQRFLRKIVVYPACGCEYFSYCKHSRIGEDKRDTRLYQQINKFGREVKIYYLGIDGKIVEYATDNDYIDFIQTIIEYANGLPARLKGYIYALKEYRRWLEMVVQKQEEHRQNILSQAEHVAAVDCLVEEAALLSIADGGEVK